MSCLACPVLPQLELEFSCVVVSITPSAGGSHEFIPERLWKAGEAPLHRPAEGGHRQGPPGRRGPISDLCEQRQIQVAQFYQWQKQLFENADAAFERKGNKVAGSTHIMCESLPSLSHCC